MKINGKSFFVNLWIGAGFAALAISLNLEQDFGLWRRICDGLFVGATVLLGTGGLRFCGNHGAFNSIGYGIKHLANTVLPWAFSKDSNFGKKETYLEYKERKEQNQKSPKELLLAGLVYLVLSLIAMAIHYAVQ